MLTPRSDSRHEVNGVNPLTCQRSCLYTHARARYVPFFSFHTKSQNSLLRAMAAAMTAGLVPRVWIAHPTCLQSSAADHLSPLRFAPARKSSHRPKSRVARCGIAEPSGSPAPMGQKTRYNDGWFDKAFMALFARKQLAAAGLSGNFQVGSRSPPSPSVGGGRRGRQKRGGMGTPQGDSETS